MEAQERGKTMTRSKIITTVLYSSVCAGFGVAALGTGEPAAIALGSLLLVGVAWEIEQMFRRARRL